MLLLYTKAVSDMGNSLPVAAGHTNPDFLNLGAGTGGKNT
jgi:hypothetical protein